MTKNPKILSIVLAGGEGTRLMPLTRDRAKPAVPFGGVYRLIDFPLSNLVNSGYRQVVVLTQYKSHSLDRHISQVWRFSPLLGSYVSPVPAQQRLGKHWYLGSADAIYQSMNLINDEDPDYVVVFGADNIYRMDVGAMLQAHIDSGLECTVAGIRVPRAEASEFGIIDADENAKILEFLEKPADPPGLPDSPEESFASMGNYVFNADALYKALTEDAKDENSKHDMGGNIVPAFVEAGNCTVYDFTFNIIPGSTKRDENYWRDVGSIDAFYEANMDLISVEPVFNLYNDRWPLLTGYIGLPPAKFVYGHHERLGHALDSIVSPGVIVSGGEVHHSVLSPNVRIHSWSQVVDSILFDGVVVNRRARVYKAILDKNVVLTENSTVGIDTEHDLARGFTVTPEGITVVPKGTVVDD